MQSHYSIDFSVDNRLSKDNDDTPSHDAKSLNSAHNEDVTPPSCGITVHELNPLDTFSFYRVVFYIDILHKTT